MKVLQINIFGNLSTGRIAVDLYKVLLKEGHEGKIAFARNNVEEGVPYIRIGTKLSVIFDVILTRLTDRAGFFSKRATLKLINEIEKYDPDIIHLHNLHGYYLNIECLFGYLKRSGKPVVWTLHDCWAFTGHCCHYSDINCMKWQEQCHNCSQLSSYPKSVLMDQSKKNYEDKKKLFLSLKNMNLVTVSSWLKGEVSKSFLKELPCYTIYNGIDQNVFHPTKGNFREKYNLQGKFIVLGVASTWGPKKGFMDFIKLSQMLDDNYVLVMIGIEDLAKLKDYHNIVGLPRTNSVKELAEIYTEADVFFNASVEETFGLPTVEAIACETPAIVYNTTALPECVTEKNGFVVEKSDLQTVKSIIENIRNGKYHFDFTDFMFDKNKTFAQYIDLYQNVIKNKM